MAAAESLDAPADIKLDGDIVDICFHPSKDVIAAGDISGEVTLHSFSTSSGNNLLMTLPQHKKSCRTVRFSLDGQELHTASKDKSIRSVDMNTGALKRKIQKAHSSPVYSMLVTGENFLATGDDDGELKIWDLRMETAALTLKENEEFISDMVINKDKKIIVATSGDGTVTAFDIRKKRMELQSELFDSELLCLSVVKGGQKFVCGDGDGVLNIFNWGEWGNISDRFPGHPMSVDCMLSLTDSIVCTGSSDGTIRAVNILPNRFIGVVGEHDGFPVENMSLSSDKSFLASCSHDQTIKFWNVSDIEKETVKNTKKKAKKTSKPKFLKSSTAGKNDFFADLGDDPVAAGGSGDAGQTEENKDDAAAEADDVSDDDDGVADDSGNDSDDSDDE